MKMYTTTTQEEVVTCTYQERTPTKANKDLHTKLLYILTIWIRELKTLLH